MVNNDNPYDLIEALAVQRTRLSIVISRIEDVTSSSGELNWPVSIRFGPSSDIASHCLPAGVVKDLLDSCKKRKAEIDAKMADAARGLGK